MEFSRLVVPQPPRTNAQSEKQKESVYWKSYRSPVFLKSYAPITHIHISPSAPHRYVVTSGTRLQIYSPKTNRVVKTIARFKETAKSGEIRDDGKLCVAGEESGMVQVFDVNSRAILRTFKAHKQPVHCTKFSPGSGTTILTTSSDCTVRTFSLSTSTPLRTFTSHTDYVRCASFVPSSPNLILSGSYDATIKLWDDRLSERGGLVWSGNCGKPVESLLVGSEGTMAISAGGNIVRVWDLLGASTSRGPIGDGEGDGQGRENCLRALSNHQKTITSLCWGANDQGEKRVLSGGLDGMVKVYDPNDNWRVRHTIRYEGQILSLAVSPNSSHLLCGLSDGSLSIRTRVPKRQQASIVPEATYDTLLTKASIGNVCEGKSALGLAGFKEEKVGKERDKKRKLNTWDRLLKDFRYGDALDSVLKTGTPPALTFALLLELIQRDALPIALANRHDLSLEPLLRFLLKFCTDVRYSRDVSEIMSVLLEIYTPTLGLSPLIDELLAKFRRKVDEELALMKDLEGVRGMLEMVFAGSQRKAL